LELQHNIGVKIMLEVPDMKNNDLSELFALNHIFDLLDLQEFDNFLRDNNMKRNSAIFEGHRFFIKTISRGLLEKLSRSWSLNIEDNYTFTRALNRGVPLEKLKNSSKRVMFIKNIHKQLKVLWSSSDFSTLSYNMKYVKQNILSSLDSILNCNVELSKQFAIFGKETVLRRLAIHYTLIYLNDARHGIKPIGYLFVLSNKGVSKKYSKRTFLGYKTTLLFLWNSLLKKENVQKKQFFENLAKAKNWKDLDDTFELAREIVASIEKEFQLTFGFETYFIVKKQIKAEIWDKKLFEKPPEPSLSKIENLQQELFWYPVQAMSGLLIFNGVATFSSLIIGAVQLKRAAKNNEKTLIVRFVHPVEKNKHDYSYAILVEAFGTLADYSGWLVFYDCCGDYSGFSGSMYQFAEMIIRQYSHRLEIINLKIDKNDLKKYLDVFGADFADTYEHTGLRIPTDGNAKRQKKFLESFSTSSIISRQQSQIEAFKGYLLELLAYYFFTSEKGLIKWRYRNKRLLGDDEIDVIKRDEKGNLYLVSCMSSYHDNKVKKLDKHYSLIQSKKGDFQKIFGTFESVEKVVFITEDPTASQIYECKKLGTHLFSLKRLLAEHSRFSSIRKTEIKRLFSKEKQDEEELFFA
jgi:hypothetical protein